MTQSTLKQLAQIKILSGLSEDQLRELAPLFTKYNFKRNQTLIAYREESDVVYFLCEGSVRTTLYSPSGKQISYQDLEPGDMFGEMAAIDNLPRSTHVIALSGGELLFLSKDNFLHLIDHYPDVSRAVLLKMSKLVRFLCERLYEYGVLSVGERVRAEILRIARQQGIQNGDTVLVDNLPTHEELASRLATHREAITRELGNLEKSGVLFKKRNKLTILDIQALEQQLNN